MSALHVQTCPAPWGMFTQEHTFTFCQIFFISGGNYTLVTLILYTTMVTHSECEISQPWRTQFSSHGAFNLMPPPPFPYRYIEIFPTVIDHPGKDLRKCSYMPAVVMLKQIYKYPLLVRFVSILAKSTLCCKQYNLVSISCFKMS